MTPEEYQTKTHEMVNEISDICATTIVTDQMGLDEVVDLFHRTLRRIDALAVYPEAKPPPPIRERKVTRTPLECKPVPLDNTYYADKGLVRYLAPGSPDWIIGRPDELFEEIEQICDGRAIQRTIIRVVDGKDVVLWREAYHQ